MVGLSSFRDLQIKGNMKILSIMPLLPPSSRILIEVIDTDPNATRTVIQTFIVEHVERVVVFPDPIDAIGMNVVIPDITDRAPRNAEPDIAGRYMALHQATQSNVTGPVQSAYRHQSPPSNEPPALLP